MGRMYHASLKSHGHKTRVGGDDCGGARPFYLGATRPKLRLVTDIDSPPAEAGNAQPYSVSELAFALKRTIEDAYGYVRLRGELSKVTRHASGHVYLTLKDDRAAIDGVEFLTSFMAMGDGTHKLPIKAELLRRLAKTDGDIVAVRLIERLSS